MAPRSPLRVAVSAALVGALGAMLQGCGTSVATSGTSETVFTCGDGDCKVTLECKDEHVTMSIGAGCLNAKGADDLRQFPKDDAPGVNTAGGSCSVVDVWKLYYCSLANDRQGALRSKFAPLAKGLHP